MKAPVILATTNQGKIAELAQALKQYGVDVTGLAEFPEIPEIIENGQSFEENALIKARTVAMATGLTAIADDSGLSVDALKGAPGIFSARYGDDWENLPGESRDDRNIRKLLHVMTGQKNRNCHFTTAMAAVKPNGQKLVTLGYWQGCLLLKPQGQNGFGYDPVFWDPELGKSAAQLSREEKNARSHRGKALAELLRLWPAFMSA